MHSWYDNQKYKALGVIKSLSSFHGHLIGALLAPTMYLTFTTNVRPIVLTASIPQHIRAVVEIVDQSA
jgi:hypothetical protein